MHRSQLALIYIEREQRWRDFRSKNLPESELLRWGEEHRVFRSVNEVWKVEWGPATSIDPELRLEYEHSLIASIEGGAQSVNPSFSVIDGKWQVLKMDWIDGVDVDCLKDQGRLRELPIFKLFYRVLQISLAGVVYKQLRARHTFVREDGGLAFVDFGGSYRTKPIIAFWWNFLPFHKSNGAWQTGRLAGIVIAWLKNESPKSTNLKGVHASPDPFRSSAWLGWMENENRPDRFKPQNVAIELDDQASAEHLISMEKYLSIAVSQDPGFCHEIIGIQTKCYSLTGARDWDFIWDNIRQHVSFSNKNVVDLMCGMGGVAAFARLSGANRVYSYDDRNSPLDAARHLSEAYGYSDNEFHSANLNRTMPRPAEMVTALSQRLTKIPREQVLDIVSNYLEVIWQVSDVAWATKQLVARGYATVVTIMQVTKDQHILYASDRNARMSR